MRLSVEYLNWACNQVIGNTTRSRGQFFHDLLAGYEASGICAEGLMVYGQAVTVENRQPLEGFLRCTHFSIVLTMQPLGVAAGETFASN